MTNEVIQISNENKQLVELHRDGQGFVWSKIDKGDVIQAGAFGAVASLELSGATSLGGGLDSLTTALLAAETEALVSIGFTIFDAVQGEDISGVDLSLDVGVAVGTAGFGTDWMSVHS